MKNFSGEGKGGGAYLRGGAYFEFQIKQGHLIERGHLFEGGRLFEEIQYISGATCTRVLLYDVPCPSLCLLTFCIFYNL